MPHQPALSQTMDSAFQRNDDLPQKGMNAKTQDNLLLGRTFPYANSRFFMIRYGEGACLYFFGMFAWPSLTFVRAWQFGLKQ